MGVPVIDGREEKLACVYIIGPANGMVRMGYCMNIHERFAALQGNCWLPVSIHHLAWVADCRVAQRLQKAAHEALAYARIRGEWFMENPDLCWDALVGAGRLQRIPVMTHAEYLAICRPARRDMRKDRRRKHGQRLTC